jgi:SAM-dependent methyltransferase
MIKRIVNIIVSKEFSDLFPKSVADQLRTARNLVRYIPNKGVGLYCPVCEKPSKRFGRFGKQDAECLHCGSLDRHRLAWLYFEQMTNLFDDETFKYFLHIAPEPCFEKRLKKRVGSGYISADINRHRAMIRMDITDIWYPSEVFDVIFCSHVLEHVTNDRKAISEFYRVLKFNGWALILVPISADRTFEDPSVTDPSERLRLFGQADHVRRYGPDFAERLREVGFDLKIVCAHDFLGTEEIMRMGITCAAGDLLYCCTKRRNPQK